MCKIAFVAVISCFLPILATAGTAPIQLERGGVWSSAHHGVLAVWLDWSTREGPFDPRVTAYRHQIRLLDAASPEAPVEVGSYDPGGRFELVGRIRTGDEPVVVIDPETLEMTEVPVVPGSTLGIRHHAVSWPWLALVRDDGAVELYRATDAPPA